MLTGVNGILTIEELCEGEVKLTIVDANGCEFKIIGNIVTWESCADLKTTLQGDYSNLLSCESPNPTGSLNLSTTGGNAPYKYLWSTGVTSSAVYGYRFKVTDGCFRLTQEYLYLPCACNAPNPNMLQLTDPLCYNSGDGIGFDGIYSMLGSDSYYNTNRDFKIIWPNNEICNIHVVAWNHGDVNIDGSNCTPPCYPTEFTSSGNCGYSISGLGSYGVKIVDSYGCEFTRCVPCQPLIEVNPFTKKFLSTLQPTFLVDFNEVVNVGCSSCKSCSYGCENFQSTWPQNICLPNNDTKFQYYPDDLKNPCTNAQIDCGPYSIKVPSYVQGNEFIDYNQNHPPSITNPGYCIYKGACYFPSGILDINSKDAFYVETEFLKPCDTPPLGCTPIFIPHPSNPCNYDIVCAETGEVISADLVNQDAIEYCYKLPLPGSGIISCQVYQFCVFEYELFPVLNGGGYNPINGTNCANFPPAIINTFGTMEECSFYGLKPPQTLDPNLDSLDIPTVKTKEISIYPNPFNKSFSVINHGSDLVDCNVQLYTMVGTLAFSQNFDSLPFGSLVNVMPLSSLPMATYIVRIKSRYQSDSFHVLIKGENSNKN